MKLCYIVGARPQFIKMAAVSRAVAAHNKQPAQDDHIEELIIHTGQHYDYELSKVFFEELEISKQITTLESAPETMGSRPARCSSA